MVLRKDSIGFSYSMTSLKVDKKYIKFVEIPESKDTTSRGEGLQYLPIDSLNTFLLSEPFTVQSGTPLSFSEGWGFSLADGKPDSAAVMSLGKNFGIDCYIELIEEGTNKQIGTIKHIRFSPADGKFYGMDESKVNVDIPDTKTIRLKMKLTAAEKGVEGMLVNETNTVNEGMLSKLAVKELTLQGSGIIKSYELGQNYPNPFNPTTTIRYQLPKEGMVTLKVYDVLGREVATLVNGYKTGGSYSVNFNASELASGVYIYQIKVNDTSGNNIYTSTKKLILLK